MTDNQVIANEFVAKLKKREVEGSQATARLTAELLRSVISLQRLPPINLAVALIEVVKSVGQKLIAANPVELVIGNIVRRVLRSIREEELLIDDISTGSGDEDIQQDYKLVSSTAARNLLRPPSLHTLLDSVPISAVACHTTGEYSDLKGKYKDARSQKLKHNIIQAVNELIAEIDFCHERIAEHAVEYIHHHEVILTLGRSRAVLKFLSAAKVKERSFRVLVAEGGPRYHGHVLAKELAGIGLKSTLITDSAVFALISRVNMVIVGVHAVLANGGVIGPVGLNMVALAARKYSVPFVVVAGIHKLSPLFPHSPEVSLNEMRSPSDVLEFGKFSDCMNFERGMGAPLLHVINPAFDYVPPELVSLLITDTGGHRPSLMYRLLSEYYSADDLVLQQKSAS